MKWLDRFLQSWGQPDEGGPGTAVRGDPERVREVQELIAELRPMLRADAGDVDLVSVEDGWVEVRLRGACKSCSVSDLTFHGALEPMLKQRFTWVVGVRTR